MSVFTASRSMTFLGNGSFERWRTWELYIEGPNVSGYSWEDHQSCLFQESRNKLLRWPSGGTNLPNTNLSVIGMSYLHATYHIEMIMVLFKQRSDGLHHFKKKYQPSGDRGTRSPAAMPHRLQHLTTRLIQNGWQGLEIGQTLGYWTLLSTFAK